MHTVILAYPRCWGMNVMMIRDFIHIAGILERKIYRETTLSCQIVTAEGDSVCSASGVDIRADCAVDGLTAVDLIVVPAVEGDALSLCHGDRDKHKRESEGWHRVEAKKADETGEMILLPDKAQAWLKGQYAENVPVLACSTGVAGIGQAGLLAGKRVSTHWAFLTRFRQKYPECRFTSHSSFIESDGLFSTGNLMGGVEAVLYHIAQHRGDRFAQLCAAHGLMASPEKVLPVLPGRRNHDDMDISRLQDWIEEYHKDALRIDAAAEHCGLSISALKRRIRQATGLSFTEYLQRVRVERAKRLLLSTDMSLRDIAWAVGYENQSFFIRLFKKWVSVTPGQYRKGNVRSF